MDEDKKVVLPEGLVIKTIMNNSVDTIYFKDIESRFILNSKAHANQLEESDPLNMLGKSDFDYFPKEFAVKAFNDEQDIIKTGIPVLGRVERWDKDDGETVWFLAYKYPLYDNENKIIGTWGISRDISNLKRTEEKLQETVDALANANEKLKELSVKDSLSELFNRHYFYEVLTIQEENLIRKNVHFSILFIDINDFKMINDTHGHVIGDEVIATFSRHLSKIVRVTDLVFRIGGDEFAIIIPNSNLEEGNVVAQKIDAYFNATSMMVDKCNFKLSLSIGVSNSCETNNTKKLLALADQRMYMEKENLKSKRNVRGTSAYGATNLND